MSHQPDKPVAGLYKMRLVRNGPWVPVRIWFAPSCDPATGEECDRSPHWQAEINGQPCDSIWSAWPSCSGRPIDEADYHFMLAGNKEAQTKPLMPINLRAARSIF